MLPALKAGPRLFTPASLGEIVVRKIRSRVALAFGVAGIIFFLCTISLPFIKTHQTAVNLGPTSGYGGSDTTFSGWLVPPIDQGSRVNIVLTGYTPNSILFSVFASPSGDISASGSPLISVSNFTASIERLSFVSPETQAYTIFVFSGNRTQFVMAVEGYWSPYYPLRGYASEALFIALGGFLAYYYFRHFELRRSIEEKATKEATSGSSSPPGQRKG